MLHDFSFPFFSYFCVFLRAWHGFPNHLQKPWATLSCAFLLNLLSPLLCYFGVLSSSAVGMALCHHQRTEGHFSDGTYLSFYANIVLVFPLYKLRHLRRACGVTKSQSVDSFTQISLSLAGRSNADMGLTSWSNPAFLRDTRTVDGRPTASGFLGHPTSPLSPHVGRVLDSRVYFQLSDRRPGLLHGLVSLSLQGRFDVLQRVKLVSRRLV